MVVWKGCCSCSQNWGGLEDQGADFYLVVGGQERELKTFSDYYSVMTQVIWGRQLDIFSDYGVQAVPPTVFVDKDGLMVGTGPGWGKNSLERLKELVAELTAQQ